MKNIILSVFFALICQTSYATNTTQQTQSTATLTSSCIISSTGFSFGNLKSGQQSSTSGSFYNTCTKGTPYTIKFGWGNNIGTASQCQMTYACPRMSLSDHSDYIPYYILLEDNYHAAGDGYYGNVYTSSGTGSLQTLTLNANTYSNFFPKPGSYKDDVVVQVIY